MSFIPSEKIQPFVRLFRRVMAIFGIFNYNERKYGETRSEEGGDYSPTEKILPGKTSPIETINPY